MGFFGKSSIKKMAALSVAKKMIGKDSRSQADMGELASSTIKDFATSYGKFLKFKLAIPLFIIGLITFFFSPVYGFFICALAVLFFLNTGVSIEFLVLGIITLNLYHAFNSIKLAVAITLPLWILYNIFQFLKAPSKPELNDTDPNSPDSEAAQDSEILQQEADHTGEKKA